MFRRSWCVWVSLVVTSAAHGQEMHDHGVPEKLGKVSFPITCDPGVQQPFNRAVALLHSFAYGPATKAFRDVAAKDPKCAMAHWGVAMTYFHPVWTPALPPDTFTAGQQEMLEATRLHAGTPRERQYVHALGELYKVDAGLTSAQRSMAYEKAMAELARDNPKDVEAQVFYAVALLSNAAPTDKTHAKQKQAIGILEPLFRTYPDHPGIAHYLIHATDSAALAQRGLPAARKYATIAPSAPHALHMPSHIFTRLGLWDDSIQSNLASEASAREHGDTRERLHAMDYLVYAYMQTGRAKEAGDIVNQMRAIPNLDMSDFAIAYAATAMPIRIAVEQARWADASATTTPDGVPPSVAAIAVWAKGLGLARAGHPVEARQQAERLGQIEKELAATGDTYYSVQTRVLADEVLAWSAQANGDTTNAEALLRSAADKEDALEKRPVTPGPILPAREQLGDLLLMQKHPELAQVAFKAALAESPGRAGALRGEARATQSAH